MFNINARYQSPALPRAETPAEPVAAPRVSPLRRFSLRSLVAGFAFVAEARTLPFAGVAFTHDHRTRRDY